MNIFEYFNQIDNLNDVQFNEFMESMGAPSTRLYDNNIDISKTDMEVIIPNQIDFQFKNEWQLTSNNGLERKAA